MNSQTVEDDERSDDFSAPNTPPLPRDLWFNPDQLLGLCNNKFGG
jgi:hypothetical protein